MMKKMIALLMAVVMVTGGVRVAPVLAAENTIHETVAEKEESEEETTEIEDADADETVNEASIGVSAEDNYVDFEQVSTESAEEDENIEETEVAKVAEKADSSDAVDKSTKEAESAIEPESEATVIDGNKASLGEEEDIIDSGTCGENLTWTLDDTGTLRISGTGRMNDYQAVEKCPWYSHKESIKFVIFGEGVTYIGERTFYRYSGLKEVTFPSTVNEIGGSAFNSNWNMEKKHISSLEDWLNIEIDSKKCVPMLKGDLYINGIPQTEAIIPEGIDTISECAFYSCNSLTYVNIPGSVTEIGSSAFESCTSLSHVSTHEGLIKIGFYAFAFDANIKEFIIPSTVTSIGNYAFSSCSSLTKMVFPEGISPNNRYPGQYMFQGCYKLEQLIIEEGVSAIWPNSFSGCTGLKILKLPKSLKNIREAAFDLCNAVTDIYYAGSESDWRSTTISSNRNGSLSNAVIHYNCGLSVALNDKDLVVAYTGLEIRPVPVVESFEGTVLNAGTDYTLSYENNIEPGTATVTVIGIGDYEGQSASVEFSIKSSIVAGISQNLYYFDTSVDDYQEFRPQPIVTSADSFLSENKDYTVEYKNNTSPGTATVTVTGIGDYSGTVEIPFYLVTVDGLEENYEYTGEEIMPTITLTADKELQEGTDYTVRFVENTKPGKEYPRIVVNGAGDYSGELVIPFIIKPRAITQLSSKPGVQRELNIKFEEHPCAEGYIVEWRYEEDGEDKEPEYREIDAESLTIEYGGSNESFEITTDDEGNHWCEFHGDSMPRAMHARIQVWAYAEENLPDGTVNYVKSDPSEELHVAAGNQIIPSEFWGFDNSGGIITYSMLKKMWKPERAIQIYNSMIKNDVGIMDRLSFEGYVAGFPTYISNDGVCSGMVNLALSLAENKMGRISYGGMDINHITKDNIGSIENDSIKLSDALKYTELMTKLKSKTRGALYNLETLYNYIQLVQSGEEPPIEIWLQRSSDVDGHSIVPVGIIGDDNEHTTIMVYDPNCHNSSDRVLYLNKGNSGEYTSWQFTMNDGESWSGTSLIVNVDEYKSVQTRLKAIQDGTFINTQVHEEPYLKPYLIINNDDREKQSRVYTFWKEKESTTDSVRIPENTHLAVASDYYSVAIDTTVEYDLNISLTEEGVSTVVMNPLSSGICTVSFSNQDSYDDDSFETEIVCNLQEGTEATILNNEEDEIQITGVTSLAFQSKTGERNDNAEVDSVETHSVANDMLDPATEYQVATDYRSIIYAKNPEDGNYTEVIATETNPPKRLLDKADVLGLRNYVYSGKPIVPNDLQVKLKDKILLNNKDYVIKCTNNTNVGTATLTIEGIGNYTGTITKTFKITQAANKITGSNYTRSYSTKVQTITLNAKASGGKLIYKSNKTAVKVTGKGKVTIGAKFTGTATITITAGNANYKTVTKKITVTVPTKTTLLSVKNNAAKKIRVAWKKNTTITGYQIQYSLKSSFASPKTVTISKNSQVTTTISKLAKGKKFYVRIRCFKTVSGKKYYSAWSGAKAVVIKK